jgi:hypothetical protein
MRHAVKERRARSAREASGVATQLMAAGDAVLASKCDSPSIDGPAPPRGAASDEMDLHRANIQIEREESSVILELSTTAEDTLASAIKMADSAAKRAQLKRIGEAFAKVRATLSDEDRRENTLRNPALTKRARA